MMQMRRFATATHLGRYGRAGAPMATLVLKAFATVIILAIALRVLGLG